MNRIRSTLSELGERKLLVPFFTVGFPSLQSSMDMVMAAEDAGADMIELGMPFSDPLADGPDIQYSSQVAIGNKVDLRVIVDAVRRLRERVTVPIILMGYYNPILSYGVRKFLGDASKQGVDGLIIPDLPVDEAAEYRLLARENRLSTIFLVAPTTTPERLREIDQACSDFVYAVTVTGVTGTGKRFDKTTGSYLRGLKRSLSRPFVAGFGVTTTDDARRLVRHANGVVIGSALVRLLKQSRNRSDERRQIRLFLSKIKRAIS